MRRVAASSPSEPMSSINVTPFIDVLLVLLIMLILTVPMATHKVPIDIGDSSTPPPTASRTHVLAIDRAGAYRFDGAPVDDKALAAALVAMQRQANYELHLAGDPEAPYDRFDHAIAIVKRANVTNLGFTGLDRMTF